MASAKFGHSQLEKFGWRSGQGLGKKEDGIKTYIRVKQRKDNAGLGAKANEDIEGQWWDRIYNEVASKIKTRVIEAKEVAVTDQEAVSDPKPKPPPVIEPPAPVRPVLKFGLFVRGGIQESASSIAGLSPKASADKSADPEPAPVPANTQLGPADAELLAACEGRTCRDNFGAEGKLKRIRQQEEEFMRQRLGGGGAPVEGCISVGAVVEGMPGLENEGKRKKKKRRVEEDGTEGVDAAKIVVVVEEKKNKKRKGDGVVDGEIEGEGGKNLAEGTTVEVVEVLVVEGSKKEKKKRRKDRTVEETTVDAHIDEVQVQPKKKEKKKKSPASSDDSIATENGTTSESGMADNKEQQQVEEKKNDTLVVAEGSPAMVEKKTGGLKWIDKSMLRNNTLGFTEDTAVSMWETLIQRSGRGGLGYGVGCVSGQVVVESSQSSLRTASRWNKWKR